MKPYKDTVLILNAPPRAGKDSLAEYIRLNICKHIENVVPSVSSFKKYPSRIIDTLRDISGISKEEWEDRYYSDLKDYPWVKLNGISQRQFIVKVCEELVKPVFGDSVFGNAAKHSIISKINTSLPSRSHSLLFVLTDGGFKEEVEPIIKAGNSLGLFDVVIAQWYAEGVDYESNNDPRKKLSSEDFKEQKASFITLPFNKKGTYLDWLNWHKECCNILYDFIQKNGK